MWWCRRSSRLPVLFALVNCTSHCIAPSPAHPLLSDESINSAAPIGRAATRRACIFVDIYKRIVRSSTSVHPVHLRSLTSVLPLIRHLRARVKNQQRSATINNARRWGRGSRSEERQTPVVHCRGGLAS